MRRWGKRLFCSLLLLGALCLIATAATSDLKLTAFVVAEHSVSVTCGSNGKMFMSNGSALGDSLIVGHMTQSTIRIEPEQGYVIANVLFGGQVLTDFVDQNGWLTLPAIYKETELFVKFARRDTGDIHVPTGISERYDVLIVSIISLFMLFLMKRKNFNHL